MECVWDHMDSKRKLVVMRLAEGQLGALPVTVGGSCAHSLNRFRRRSNGNVWAPGYGFALGAIRLSGRGSIMAES